MGATSEIESTPKKNHTNVERKADRELVVTRTINGPARMAFEAWTRAELFKQWWVPKSFGVTLVSCEMDVRVGGQYRLVFAHGDAKMAFFGKYLEVIQNSRLVWTNEEAEDGPVTTLSLEEKGDKTLVVLHDLYPSKEALDTCMTNGEKSCVGETFDQLEEVLVTLR